MVILLAALYFTYAALGAYLNQRRAHASFIPVTATVTAAYVQSSGSTTSAHGESFSPRIVYRYSVDGKAYTSERYFYVGDGWRDAAEAEAVKARYPVGSTVQAYADAGDPSQAVLDRSAPAPGILLFLLPFSAVGVGALVYGLRKRKILRP
jgi:hypothetical protein